jgi:hypothetical protein
MKTQKRILTKIIVSNATRNAQLAKLIANYLNLPYSIIDKSVKINYISNDVANIVVNNNWDNKINFDLNLLNN